MIKRLLSFFRKKPSLSPSIEEQALLTTLFPRFSNLPENIQTRFLTYWREFAHKEFVGSAGLELSESMPLHTGFWAALMRLGFDKNTFESLYTLYLYPETFVYQSKYDLGGIIQKENQPLIGQAGNGAIVLSWPDVLDAGSAYNVVIHELAHQLDRENGGALNGTPILRQHKDYKIWGEVFEEAFQKLQSFRYQGTPCPIDFYGLSDEAEFFACACESFFHRSESLKAEFPELFREMENYFGFDPKSVL